MSSNEATPIDASAAQPAASAWRNPLVQTVLPFVTSLSIHAAVIVAAMLTYQTIQLVNRPDHQEQMIIAQSDFQPDKPPTAIGDFRPSAIPGMEKGEQVEDHVPWNSGPRSDGLQPIGDSTNDNAGPIGVYSGEKTGKLGTNLGYEGGTCSGGTPFGLPNGKGGGGGSVFAPVPRGARKVAYVCDASGSMLQKMPGLKLELERAVSNLRPFQSYSVIFFQAAGCTSVSQSLLPGTPENKRKTGAFLNDVTASGETDPIPGLELAFRQQPELIYLLTDGDFQNNKAVVARIRQLSAGRAVRVNTIAFVGDDDHDTNFIAVLKAIADETHGTFKYVKVETH